MNVYGPVERAQAMELVRMDASPSSIDTSFNNRKHLLLIVFIFLLPDIVPDIFKAFAKYVYT